MNQAKQGFAEVQATLVVVGAVFGADGLMQAVAVGHAKHVGQPKGLDTGFVLGVIDKKHGDALALHQPLLQVAWLTLLVGPQRVVLVGGGELLEEVT